jgi:hypothetical protein
VVENRDEKVRKGHEKNARGKTGGDNLDVRVVHRPRSTPDVSSTLFCAALTPKARQTRHTIARADPSHRTLRETPCDVPRFESQGRSGCDDAGDGDGSKGEGL